MATNILPDESNYEEIIYSFTPADWQPLFELIPEIESTSKFGKWKGGEKDKNGNIQFPYCAEARVVSQFLEIAYGMPIIVNFDWVTWDIGQKMLKDNNYSLDTLDLPTKCKLITVIVRMDRFCEGALVSAFQSGLILKILKSIEKEVTAIWN